MLPVWRCFNHLLINLKDLVRYSAIQVQYTSVDTPFHNVISTEIQRRINGESVNETTIIPQRIRNYKFLVWHRHRMEFALILVK